LNGLEAAPSDQNGAWGCDGTVTGATGTAIGTGAANTAAILTAACTSGNDAADLASSYAGGGCTDWFLPSIDELYELYLQRAVVGGFSNSYWSSTENDATSARIQSFFNGTQGFGAKGGSFGSRAVRAF